MLNSRMLWIIGIILILLIIFLPGYTKLQELKDKKKNLEVKIDEIQLDNLRLEDQTLRMQRDPVYQEEVVREKLGVVRKGEVIYKIEPEDNQQ